MDNERKCAVLTIVSYWQLECIMSIKNKYKELRKTVYFKELILNNENYKKFMNRLKNLLIKGFWSNNKVILDPNSIEYWQFFTKNNLLYFDFRFYCNELINVKYDYNNLKKIIDNNNLSNN